MSCPLKIFRILEADRILPVLEKVVSNTKVGGLLGKGGKILIIPKDSPPEQNKLYLPLDPNGGRKIEKVGMAFEGNKFAPFGNSLQHPATVTVAIDTALLIELDIGTNRVGL